jgi:hypothetical protein
LNISHVPEKPRRGGLFIAKALKKIKLRRSDLFFGGCCKDPRPLMTNRRMKITWIIQKIVTQNAYPPVNVKGAIEKSHEE